MFKNKIGTKVADENVYAVNSMTRGVDLTHNNLVKENELVKIENMNEIEKEHMILQIKEMFLLCFLIVQMEILFMEIMVLFI